MEPKPVNKLRDLRSALIDQLHGVIAVAETYSAVERSQILKTAADAYAAIRTADAEAQALFASSLLPDKE